MRRISYHIATTKASSHKWRHSIQKKLTSIVNWLWNVSNQTLSSQIANKHKPPDCSIQTRFIIHLLICSDGYHHAMLEKDYSRFKHCQWLWVSKSHSKRCRAVLQEWISKLFDGKHSKIIWMIFFLFNFTPSWFVTS